MKYTITLICFAITCSLSAQNTFPTAGNASIQNANLLLQNNTSGAIPLLSFKDTRYEPGAPLLFDFLTDSDGLFIRYNNFSTIYHRFRRTGDFIVYAGNIGVGTTDIYPPTGRIHIHNNGGASVPGLTFSDARYLTTATKYDFVTEQDGLHINQDNTTRYQFKNGGDFIVNTGSVGIGTTYLDSNAKLTVKGQVYAQEVKVQITAGAGQDVVFEPTYKLKSLTEVEKYIQENKHLPDIAPAKEMEEQGLKLGEMDMKLLQKLEELTLYMIDLQKEVNTLKEQNQKLETELKKRSAK